MGWESYRRDDRDGTGPLKRVQTINGLPPHRFKNDMVKTRDDLIAIISNTV